MEGSLKNRKHMVARIGAVVFSLLVVTAYVAYRAAGKAAPAVVDLPAKTVQGEPVLIPGVNHFEDRTMMWGSKSAPVVRPERKRQVMSGSKIGIVSDPDDFVTPPEPGKESAPPQPAPAQPSQPKSGG